VPDMNQKLEAIQKQLLILSQQAMDQHEWRTCRRIQDAIDAVIKARSHCLDYHLGAARDLFRATRARS